jgi:hypothetical protein
VQPVGLPVKEKKTIKQEDNLENHLEVAGIGSRFLLLHSSLLFSKMKGPLQLHRKSQIFF